MNSKALVLIMPLIIFSVFMWTTAIIATPEPERRSFCDEVEVELNESVKTGLLTDAEAQQIANRCYRRFAGLYS